LLPVAPDQRPQGGEALVDEVLTAAACLDDAAKAGKTEHLTRGLVEPALDAMLARLDQTACIVQTISAEREDLRRQRVFIERQKETVEDWLSTLVDEAEQIDRLDFRGCRERVRRLGIKVVVWNRGDAGPRFDVAIELLIPAEEFFADPTPWERPSTLEVYRVGEEEPAAPEWLSPMDSDSPPQSRPGDNSRAGPSADTAGGPPRRNRTGRRPQSRS
jgi:hypothetical protein